jgi:hypothetical protein
VPKGKASLWAENCPNFFFFFVWAGTLWALVTSPKGAGKTEVFSGKKIFGSNKFDQLGLGKLPHSVPKGKGKP